MIFGVEKDAPIADQILELAPGACESRVGKTSLAELIEELKGCDVLLTNDTGTMHLAGLLGVPTVAIFGSTEPALTGPLGQGHRVLRRHVECSPCFLRECPLDFRCMRAVEVDDVVAALDQVLARIRTNNAASVS
ncbi:MAG: glycosyltransferase family 9 protein [Verrucomicrobiaceae bacterium]|nr:MAG: glycosyltransferase family 9 protein [Verrucomicrobiaceae bacterium]